MSKTIVLTREVTVPVSPEALWPQVSNTDRLNRALGLPEVRAGGKKSRAYRLRVTAKLYGLLPLAWIEHPFEWVEGRYYSILRDFESGPITRYSGRVDLIPEGGGTRVVVRSEFTPRNALGALLIRNVTGKNVVDGIARAAQEVAGELSRGEQNCYVARRIKTPPDREAFASRAESLKKRSCPVPAVERLLAHLENAHDDELSGMRPFELADRWSLDRGQVLKTFLHAVRAGLLDLSWHVLCPNCSAGPGVGGLSLLKGQNHCGTCGIDYGLDLDETVELRFAVSPSVRRTQAATFCVGSPARTPFAAAQFAVAASGRALEVKLSSQSYVLRDLCGKRSAVLRPRADGPSELSPSFDGRELSFRPGPVTLKLDGVCESALVRLEASDWKDKAAKACLVTSLQDFRDLFGTDVLAPGVEIAVKSIALLFTDLKGSTAMYEKVGDATAYGIVRDHFDYLFDIVARRRGAVVKTIGDAVMACFSSTADAVGAALEMQERVGELNERLAPRPPVVLKIGVHQGPAIAINASGMLDYFGTTANVAARVQNESEGGDVVVSDCVAADPASSRMLDGGQWTCAPFEIKLKGLSETFRLRRITRKK